jgi:hypothetical protein
MSNRRPTHVCSQGKQKAWVLIRDGDSAGKHSRARFVTGTIFTTGTSCSSHPSTSRYDRTTCDRTRRRRIPAAALISSKNTLSNFHIGL